MSYEKLEEDLARRGMHLMVKKMTPGLRYTWGYWFITKQDVTSDIITVRMPAHRTYAQVMMAEGIVARHFPGYVLDRHSIYGWTTEIHFLRRPFEKK